MRLKLLLLRSDNTRQSFCSFVPITPKDRIGTYYTLVRVGACGAVVANVLVGFGVSLTGLAMSGMVALCWWSWGTFRWHYAVMSAAIFALSFAPLFDLAEPATLAGSPLQYGVLGVVMGVGGILDHVMLMRMRAAVRLGGGANG